MIALQAGYLDGSLPGAAAWLVAIEKLLAEARAAGWLVLASRHGWQRASTQLLARLAMNGKGIASGKRPSCIPSSADWPTLY